MHEIIDLLKTLLADPDKLMNFITTHGGLYIVMFIIFAETGLFVALTCQQFHTVHYRYHYR